MQPWRRQCTSQELVVVLCRYAALHAYDCLQHFMLSADQDSKEGGAHGQVLIQPCGIHSSIVISTPTRCADVQGDSQAEAGRAQRVDITARMDELLADGAALLLPAATSAAPRLSLSSEETDPIWKSLAKLTAAAGLARLPQARAAFAPV